jgi:hypothetical protein
VSKNTDWNWKTSAFSQCNGLPVAISTLELNFGGVSTSNKIFTVMILEEILLCRCCDTDVLVLATSKGFPSKIRYPV